MPIDAAEPMAHSNLTSSSRRGASTTSSCWSNPAVPVAICPMPEGHGLRQHRPGRSAFQHWTFRLPRAMRVLPMRCCPGLTSSSGGMVAAATTSLPERARQGTSYDYRYSWIRDQCYAGEAALRAGA